MRLEVTTTTFVDVPDKATHFWSCDFTDGVEFYYCTIINEIEHWWVRRPGNTKWYLASHHMPSIIKPLSELPSHVRIIQ